MQMSGDKGISAFPESDNLFKWIGTIDGAQGTVGVVFSLGVRKCDSCKQANVGSQRFLCKSPFIFSSLFRFMKV